MRSIWLSGAVAVILLAALPAAQPVFRGSEVFPPEEFAARRARLMAHIGDAVAVLQGTTERPGEQPLRQNNEFFYLTGVVEPRALLIVDGRAKTSSLFLRPRDARREERMFGPGLSPGEEAAKATGIEAVLPRDQFGALLAEAAKAGGAIYTPFRPEVLGEASSGDPVALWRATKEDPWDGRPSREDVFVEKLKAALPGATVKDLDPILDEMRVIKSPREIAVIREATRISGLAIMEAMRDARPGMSEFELQAPAEFVFKKFGAYGPSYFALIATGRNTIYSHYHKGTAVLGDGDLVQMDYGCDFKYYQGDITRTFPANGTFTPRQREHYAIALRLYQALMTSIRVHAAPRDILKQAVVKMDDVLASFAFTDPKIKEAAVGYVDRYRKSTANSLGHSVGMEVHDVGPRGGPPTLEPGQVFTIEPALQLPDERLGIRLEDMLLVTETGYENLSAFVPIDADAIEKLMAEPGLSDAMLRPAGQARPQRPPIVPPVITAPSGSAAVEQTKQGDRPAAEVVASFDGLGVGFEGPHGMPTVRNPSDNTLAVGPDHVVQIVNTRMAIFTKTGKRFDTTGRVLWGAAPTNLVFRGFGGMCETTNNGDAVARYDQLADRWLIVMPIFRRAAMRSDQPSVWTAGPTAYLSPPGRPGQPGSAVRLPDAPAKPPDPVAAPATPPGPRPAPGETPTGPYSMCYAVSTGPDPMGPYYRYEFLRPLFPDYPRPAIWTDGYYVPTSTGDDPISETIATQKHACVADRARMLRGEPAAEQCVILNDVGFLNNADIDGKSLPPQGAPNIMMATGGVQLRKQFESDRIDVWQFKVDWANPAGTRITGPKPVVVAPYHYLCDGQLAHCVPQPGTESRLDAQGDKIMSRLVYRKIGSQESLVAVHSVNTTAGGGGVRWYEFRVGANRDVRLHQQGTYAPDGSFRWMASPAIDRLGNIAVGYSFGGTPHFPGQRLAARLAGDRPGLLTLREAVLVEGEGAQAAMRWEDYTATAIDPTDDCTIWYVGDYVKKGAASYSTRIGAFRLPGCGRR
jgi:Xaa-Pro aminopeptidase